MPAVDKSFVDIVKSSRSMREASIILNLPFSTFKRRAIEEGLYFTNQSLKGYPKGGISLEEILKGLHPKYRNSDLRKRLIRSGYWKDSCQRCGWNKKRKGFDFSSCELHHKDGNHQNNNFENLEYLCPNCHSLEEGFRKSHKYTNVAKQVDAQS